MIIQADKLADVRRFCGTSEVTLCSGSFDLLHPGHVDFLKRCKRIGSGLIGKVLVVSVGGNLVIKYLKGNGRPILNEHARLRMVDALKPVDFCYLDTVSSPENPLAAFLEHAFLALRPDFYIVGSDTRDIEMRVAYCEKFRVNLRVIDKNDCDFPTISTGSLIAAINESKLKKERAIHAESRNHQT